MKNKRIVALLVLCFICSAMCSCLNHRADSLEIYQIYVCETHTNTDSDRGDVIYNEADNIYIIPKKQLTKKSGEADKQLKLGEESIILNYESTFNKDYCEYCINSYSNKEYGIKAYYRTDNGVLDYLRLGNYKYRVYDGIIDTETKLADICTNYLSEYVDEIASYDRTIVTNIQSVNDNGLNDQSIDGYISPLAYNDSSISYQVDFTYYICGIKTSENISMRIDSNGYIELLSLNMIDAFDYFSNCDIDITRCNELISSQMKDLCDVGDFQYNGYTDTKILIILNNKLCLLSYAKPIYEPTDDMGDFFASPIQLLVPVAER